MDLASRIMTMRACLRPPSLRRIFRDDFFRKIYPQLIDSVHQQLQSFEEHQHLLLYKLWNLAVRQRRFTFSSPMVDRYLFEQRTPFTDNDFVDWALGLPTRHLFMESAYKNMIVQCFPAISQVPWEYTGRAIPCNLWMDLAGETRRGASKVITKLRRHFRPTSPHRGQLANAALRAKIERFCNSDAFCGYALDFKKVKEVVSSYFNGQGSFQTEIALLATLAEGCRLFIEDQFRSPPDDVTPILTIDNGETH